jgi:hypothetical protein
LMNWRSYGNSDKNDVACAVSRGDGSVRCARHAIV